MPEFVMEGRDHAARAESAFVLGFIEAMFFTETSPGWEADEWFSDETESEKEQLNSLPGDVGYTDIAPETLLAIRADCEAWQCKNAYLLTLAYERDYDAAQAGRDYWFTRNGHGVGFWDRKELEADGLGDKLTEASQYREVWAEYGDDRLVHVSGLESAQ